MPNVVLSRVLRSAPVENAEHSVLQRDWINAFADNIILMEHMAEEVAVIELEDNILLDVRRQLLEPVGVIAPQRDVQRQNILHLISVNVTVADGRACRGKPVEEGLFSLIRRTFEEVTDAGWK